MNSKPNSLDLKRHAAYDFALFARLMFPVLNPSVTLDWNWHHEAIAYYLSRCGSGQSKRFLLTMPPRSLKSQLTSVLFPAWMMGRSPQTKFICASYSQVLADRHSRDFAKVMNSRRYKEIFPHVTLSKDTEELIETSVGGFRLATSIGGSITGQGCDFLIIDDPLKADLAHNQNAREGTNDWFSHVAYSRLNHKVNGVIIITMQRLHEGDLAGHVLEMEPWDHLKLSAEAESDETIDLGNGGVHHRKTGDVLHPAREPKFVLDRQARMMGQAAYQAQYQQNPLPDTGNVIQSHWIRYCTEQPERRTGEIIISVDTASKGEDQHDYTAFTIWHLNSKTRQSTLLDVIRIKGEFPEIVSTTVRLHEQYKPNALLVEDRGSGTSLIQELKFRYGIRAIPLKYPGDKKTRMRGVTPAFEAGDVIFIADAPYLSLTLPELLGFPHQKHDDVVDTISQYLTWVRERPRPDIFEVYWD